MKKRVIRAVILESIKKGMTLNVVQRYLKIKYKIKASLKVLTKRKENLN